MKARITKPILSVCSIALFSLVLLNSCTKDDNISPGQTEISFDFKGKHYEFKGSAIGLVGPGA